MSMRSCPGRDPVVPGPYSLLATSQAGFIALARTEGPHGVGENLKLSEDAESARRAPRE